MESEHRPYIVDEEQPINIGSQGESETEHMLSNFAPTPFVMHDMEYNTIESFWQGLYFPEDSEERVAIAQMDGKQAKKAGRKKPSAMTSVSYQGEEIEIGSPEHHTLMREALQLKFEQNAHVRELLMATDNRPITHILYRYDGTVLPDSVSIPNALFAQMLMDIRETLQNEGITETSQSVTIFESV